MKICGIITEYNPFHHGHMLHLNSAKKLTNADAIVCVMSGNFMQRGLPSIIDKWQRSKIAIDSGVDLVVELPTLFSLSSAEFFAQGAINILNKIPNTNYVFFGSEEGSTDLLNHCASLLAEESTELKNLIKSNLSSGTPYTIARANALYSLISNKTTVNKEDFFKFIGSSNNILGLEYTKALIRSNSQIKPLTFKRQSNNYNTKSLTGAISSATAIREALKHNTISNLKTVLPSASFNTLSSLVNSGYPLVYDEDMFPYIKYKILTNPNCLTNIPECSEGLDNKIYKELPNATSLSDLITKVKSKRYTYTRISRILAQIYIGLDLFDINALRKSSINYIRVLGFNNTGREILKNMKNNDTVKIITKFPKNIDDPLLKIDLLSTNAYHLLNNNVKFNHDYFHGPYIKLQ